MEVHFSLIFFVAKDIPALLQHAPFLAVYRGRADVIVLESLSTDDAGSPHSTLD